jgi:hypothetical protein
MRGDDVSDDAVNPDHDAEAQPRQRSWIHRLSPRAKVALTGALLLLIGAAAVSLVVVFRDEPVSRRLGHNMGYHLDDSRGSGEDYVERYGSVRGVCTELVGLLLENPGGTVPYFEAGERRDVRFEDFDKAEFIDGCSEGFLAAHPNLKGR